MFNEKNVSFVNRQKLWNFYNEKLSKAVDIGYSSDLDFYDEDLAKSLKENIKDKIKIPEICVPLKCWLQRCRISGILWIWV